MEAKLQNIRRMATESIGTISVEKDDIKAYLLNKKELIFKRTNNLT
jgi:hypothetical protein